MLEENYISLTQATRYCDYSQEYLSLRARQGKLKAVKFGRNWVTQKEWLDEYLKENQKSKIPSPATFQKSEEKPSLFQRPKFRYAFRYALAGVLVFCLLTTGIVFGKDAFKNVIQNTSIAFSGLSNFIKEDITDPFFNTKEGISLISSVVKKERERVYSTFSDLHPIQDFEDTMNFIFKNTYKTSSIISDKFSYSINYSLEKLITTRDEFVSNSTIVLNASLRKSKTVLNNSLENLKTKSYYRRQQGSAEQSEAGSYRYSVGLNKMLDKVKQSSKEIVMEVKPARELKNYFFNLGASIFITTKNSYSFLAKASVETGEDLKYGINVWQKFSQWYGRQAMIVAHIVKETPSKISEKIVNTSIALKQSYQEANNIVEEKMSKVYRALTQLWKTPEKIVEEIPEEELLPKTKEGMVVIPSTEKDQEMEEKIKESFSDEVRVEMKDEDSGIITPIFKEREGDKYLYIMVPLKE